MKRNSIFGIALILICLATFSYFHYRQFVEIRELKREVKVMKSAIPRIAQGAFRKGDILTKGSDYAVVITESSQLAICFSGPWLKSSKTECVEPFWMVSDHYFDLVTPGNRKHEELKKLFPHYF